MHSYHWVSWGGVLVSVVKLDKKWSHLQDVGEVSMVVWIEMTHMEVGNLSWECIHGGLDRNGASVKPDR